MTTPGEPSKTRTVRVKWRFLLDPVEMFHLTRVNLTEGYSDEADIPKILAIRYLRSVEDAPYVEVEKVEELPKEEQ